MLHVAEFLPDGILTPAHLLQEAHSGCSAVGSALALGICGPYNATNVMRPPRS